jgi:gentisate 1,2-dioxygenase
MSDSYKVDRPSDALSELHGEVAEHDFVPGWNRPGNPPLWDLPKTNLIPTVWHYAAARAMLLRAGDLIDTDKAERRNLIMVNPTEGNAYPTTRTQVVAYQMLLPGEKARTHRHSPHAGRLVLEADEDAYTVVNGVRIPMRSGDVLLTPGWHWHGHGHDGTEPAFWIDFLDAPLVQLLEPMFFESYPGGWQEPEETSRESTFLYPYSETKARLTAEQPHPSGCFGRRIELVSPSVPTLGLYVHQIDAGYATRRYRTTANYQYCVMEGTGRSVIGGEAQSWSRGDVIAVPCWREQQHSSSDGAVLLAITDEPVQEFCGYLRTEIALDGDEGVAVLSR